MGQQDRCPICKKPLPENAAAAARYRPFCSERCQRIDLGAWLDGSYRISRPVEQEDMDDGGHAAAADPDEIN